MSASAGPTLGATLGVGGGLGGGLGPRPGRLSRARTVRSVRYYLPAVVVFIVAIVGWELIFAVLRFESFLLPKPSAIVAALQANWSGGRFPLLPSAIATFQEAILGLSIGTGAGVVVAFVSARWLTARGILLPLAVAANAVPIIAFAPITNNWFGLLNPVSKMAIAAVLCFFPVMVNTLRGLTSVNPRSIELMRSYAAGDVSVFRHVRIPNSLPFMFTGLKVPAVLSMIGAIVGEYFGGPTNALGVSILNDTQLFNFPRAWAGIVLASGFGIAFYAAVAFVERMTTSWHPSARGFRGE